MQVSRTSDALAAKRSTARTFDGLLVGLAGLYPAVRAARVPPTRSLAG